MKSIKILGTGCDKCETLAARAKEAVDMIGGGYDIEKVSNVAEIMTYGVMMTPALVVDGEVKSVGKIPSVDEIRGMLA